jgi:flagellar motor switch protein FliN
MTEHEAVERAIGLIAQASARTLAALSGTEASVESLSVVPAEGAEIDVPRPVVSARVPFTSILEGDNYFLLQPEQAANLAKAMMGDAYPGDGGELTEIELSAIAEAMNQMMGGACSALADELSIEADIAPPEVKVLEEGDDVAEIADAVYVARFRLVSPVLEAELVQLISQDFAGRLYATLSSAEQARSIVGDAAPSVGAAGGDSTFTAVERTARITAESAAEVLTTLVGEAASATIPTIDVDPGDPLGALDYPLIAVEVAYVSGVTGNNLFVLSPEQASKLAALMMGMPEPMGDGLSDMELSAVSEAMNQMMGAATNVMADTLTMAIEVAPPTCTVIQSVDEARAAFSDCAFSASFRLMSSAFEADVVQLVSAEFASHLRDAFESSAAASAVVADAPLAAPVPAAEPPAAPTGWEHVAAPSAYDDRRLRDVRVRLSAELGRTRLPVSRVANLPAGAVVKLDRTPADAVDVLINGLPFAQARLVLVDGEYAVQIVSLKPLEVAA